jgi:hypothetical protein
MIPNVPGGGRSPSGDYVDWTTHFGHARPLANSGLMALRQTLAIGRPGSRSQRPFSYAPCGAATAPAIEVSSSDYVFLKKLISN